MKKSFLERALRAANGREMQVSICQLQGRQPGPTLTLIAGQHGNEHMGPVVLRRFVEVCPANFRGTINVCPCANPFALSINYGLYPEHENPDELQNFNSAKWDQQTRDQYNAKYNMNRLWDKRGQSGLGVAGEIVSWLWDTVCEPADLIVDFHCRTGVYPLIYAKDSHEMPCACFFGAPGIQIPADNKTPAPMSSRTLVSHVNQGHRRAFCVEFSIQGGYRCSEIPGGVDGILNVMKGIGMLPGRVVHQHPVYIIRSKYSREVAAEAIGHIVYHRAPYETVAAGDLLFDVRSLENFDVLHRGVAPMDGVISEVKYARPIASPEMHVCAVHRTEVAAEAGVELKKISLS